MDDPSTIYSGHELRSGLISIHQNLGERVEFGDGCMKTDRDVSSEFAYPGYYYSEPFMPKVVLLAPVLKFFLPGDWTFTTSFTSGKDEDNYLSYYVTPDSSTLQSAVATATRAGHGKWALKALCFTWARTRCVWPREPGIAPTISSSSLS